MTAFVFFASLGTGFGARGGQALHLARRDLNGLRAVFVRFVPGLHPFRKRWRLEVSLAGSLSTRHSPFNN